MNTALFDYDLPERFIAQQPAEPRDSSRLLVLDRRTGAIEHRAFRDVGDYMQSGDLLVANNSRVIPARLHGHKASGGRVEIFLLRTVDGNELLWRCLVRGRNLKAGTRVILQPHAEGNGTEKGEQLGAELSAEIVNVAEDGTRIVRFDAPPLGLGEIPLPPYITDFAGDRERYQTVYSQPQGSAAAPTAGLHFTPELLHTLHDRGVRLETLTLHVGLDTFRPVTSARVEDHVIHSEWAELSVDAARHINEASLAVKRIVAVGTTSVRTLEWAATRAQGIDPYDARACPWQRVAAFAGSVDLFIRPGYRFRAVDRLITNFHLPRSSLLMLVSAFINNGTVEQPESAPDYGRQLLLHAYEEAKREGYRFYSFGDAMLIV